jgi:hypothetical protein
MAWVLRAKPAVPVFVPAWWNGTAFGADVNIALRYPNAAAAVVVAQTLGTPCEAVHHAFPA